MHPTNPELPVWIRDRQGAEWTLTRPAAWHRRMHIWRLHERSPGFIEVTPGTRPPGEKVQVNRRTRVEHFLTGGAAGDEHWLDAANAHAEEIMRGEHQAATRCDPPREEAFIAPATYAEHRATRDTVIGTHALWVDVDGDINHDEMYRVTFAALLARKPPHLIVESAGSGGRHAYWLLSDLLPGLTVDEDGLRDEPIERHNRKILGLLGVRPDNPQESIGDQACANRTRVMRLAGTQNWKTGEWARIVALDLHRPAYDLEQLTGDLDDPTPPAAKPRKPLPPGPRRDFDDWLRTLDPASYFWDLAGISVPDRGFVTCPFPDHDDHTPSCLVYGPGDGFHCFGCGRGGQSAIDLVSAVQGGPTNRQLKGDAFLAAKTQVCERYGWPLPGRPAPVAGWQHEPSTQGGIT